LKAGATPQPSWKDKLPPLVAASGFSAVATLSPRFGAGRNEGATLQKGRHLFIAVSASSATITARLPAYPSATGETSLFVRDRPIVQQFLVKLARKRGEHLP